MLGSMTTTIIKVYVRTIIVCIVAYFAINIYLFTTHARKIEKMALTIQQIVEENGYIPPKFMDQVYLMISDEYVTKRLNSSQEENETTIRGLNNFITNVHIVLYDYKTTQGINESDDVTGLNEEEYKYRVSEGNNRVNIGNMKRVGIAYTYNWFNPIYAYGKLNQRNDTADGKLSDRIGYNNLVNNVDEGGDEELIEETTEEDFQKNIFAIPCSFCDNVITMKAYPDLPFN